MSTSPSYDPVAGHGSGDYCSGMERGGRRRDEGTGGPQPKTGAASVPGKTTLVEAAYPTLARALRSDAAAPGGLTMDDVATAAVENKGSGAPVDPGVASKVG